MRWPTVVLGTAALVAFLPILPLSLKFAHAEALLLDPLAPNAIKLDGRLKEWPEPTTAKTVLQPGKATAQFVVGYDEQGLWVGAEVIKEGPLARTASFGANEDCVSLLIAFPKPGLTRDYAAYEVGFYAGVSGQSAGSVRFRAGASAGRTIDGAKLVEATKKGGGGYELEAFVPWTAFAEGKTTRAGLRGAMRLYDGTGTQLRAIKATGGGSLEAPKDLDYLLNEPEQGLPQALAARKQTLADQLFDVNVDLAGDGMLERALFFRRQLYVLGPTYKQGKQWLSVELGADVLSVEARDVTGDGKSDLLVTTRSRGTTTRDALTVYALKGTKGAETPDVVFAHETQIEGSGGALLRDAVTFNVSKGRSTATIDYQTPKVWSASSYREPAATDVDGILLPWGGVKQRLFLFDAQRGVFLLDKEVPQKPTLLATATPPSPGVPANEPAKAPPATDTALAALRAYRKERGLGTDVAPHLESSANMLGGAAKGRAAIFGHDLVLATGAADGSYLVISMSKFQSERDILELTARDLTGDGRDELIVRGIVRAKLTTPKGDKEVLRELLTIYAPKSNGSGLALQVVFAAEVARSVGADRVDTQLKLTPAKAGKAGSIELGRGSAKGWTESTYPFASENPMAGLEALVLPWSKSSAVYQWNGERFAR